ncbi:uncharacterized protein NECHADRAFT_84891 [Fusarium vanettenii 77-13-4]|uniref:Uncharacterized protein n=1 Tax=Fusarium vanettenii (strain ATCC MYA-4622 / CBS 123669 / FGSC 9596 / NRRL 45880 / 77-13-4) TaxID=660122 RepID=C7YUE2_FUSV7|nr:uncharacterized protein NECHADRAFT_84891 [Fusarium vanettenii 77-13-4]EEU44396.1 predicted protein [Fusarium vanettenii 77-13-4]
MSAPARDHPGVQRYWPTYGLARAATELPVWHQFFSRGDHVSLLATIRILQANDCASARTTALACLTIEKAQVAYRPKRTKTRSSLFSQEGLEFQAELGVDQDGDLRQLQQQWSQQHRIGCNGSTPSYNHPLYVLPELSVLGGRRDKEGNPTSHLGTRRKAGPAFSWACYAASVIVR